MTKCEFDNMPSVVNDENSPLHAQNTNVVVHPDPDRRDPSLPKLVAIKKPPKIAIDQPNGSFADNSSSSSLDHFNSEKRMSEEDRQSSSMTTLPNGWSSKSANGVVLGNGNSDATLTSKIPTGQHPPQVNGSSRPSEPQRSSTSESYTKRTSAESPPQTPYVSQSTTPQRKPLPNGEPAKMDGHPTRSPDPAPSSLAPRNAQSTSSPTTTTPATTPPDVGRQKTPPLPTLQRFSSPPSYPPTASVSTSALAPPPGVLKHRHTLEVPKVQSARGSVGGNDAAFTSGRFSPPVAGAGVRRASLSLARRNTRSLHSEMPRDEVLPDDDALRWAEAYRQKRAKKKRREEEDEDRVLVGTKVDESHANYATAYNMLTGIRVSVSRTNAKLDRPLTDADFEAKQKSTFDIAGNELVPSAKYDFKFKDYAPWVFRHLRALFRLDPADYLMSLTGKYILSELGSPGKSGSFFYFSRDYKYIIKTIHHAEHKFLRRILKDYYNHVTDNPNTLLSQFYGLHRVKMPYGKKIHFVIMNNLFPPHRDIHTTFDLKGSTIGRDYKEEDLDKNPRATLKDLNWLRRTRHLELGLQKKQLFLQQLESDVRLLQKLKIMDYSLLIGIHDLRKGNEENLRDKTLQVFNPGGSGPNEDNPGPATVLMRTPSKLESARKARELRQMLKSERPIPLGQTAEKMPEELEEGYSRGGLFYNDDGGLRATHENDQPAEEVYYLGVIDCLTHYGMIKKIEHFWKGLSSDRTQISALPPQEYGERFLGFMSGITMSPEEVARDAHDREVAAAAAAAAAEASASTNADQPTLSGASSTPTYLPPAPPGMRSPGSPEPNPVFEKALKKATKKEKDVAKEENVPDRKITTSTTSNERVSAHAILPIVEESAEAASFGGSGRERFEDNQDGNGSRPYTPTGRQDGYTDLAPHGIGGRGPPTPPKTSYLEPNSGYSSGPRRSGSSGGGSIGAQKGLRHRISREDLDKALPPLPS